MSSVFVLGPSISITEPGPGEAPAPDLLVGKRRVVFDDPPTKLGGVVRLLFVPAATPTDTPPINVYAFYVNPPTVVPSDGLTPDWFFAQHAGALKTSGYVPISPTVGPNDPVTVQVPNVIPGAHHVQIILEFNA